MKLVIDIPEWLFNTCKSLVECGDASGEDVIIANGTPVKTDEDRPQGEWIPVSERLPEYSGLYLVSTDCLVTIADFICGEYFMHRGGSGGLMRGITAWMPLPEPYEKGDRE